MKSKSKIYITENNLILSHLLIVIPIIFVLSLNYAKAEINPFKSKLADTQSKISQRVIQLKKISMDKIKRPNLEKHVLKFLLDEKVSSGPIEPVATNEPTDFKIYDYAKVNNQASDHKLYDQKLSPVVQNAIKREIAQHKNPEKPKVTSPSSMIESEVAINRAGSTSILGNSLGQEKPIEIKKLEARSFDYSRLRKPKQDYEYSSKLQASQNQFYDELIGSNVNTVENRIYINGYNVDLKSNEITKAEDFEFVPDYQMNETYRSDKEGVILLEYSSNGENGYFSGLIKSEGRVNTRVDVLNLSYEINVPMFSTTSLEELFNKEDIKGSTGVLVELKDEIQDVEIDSGYEKKIYLDDHFKVSEKNPRFIFFMGTQPGNLAIKYLLESGVVTSKLSFVNDHEVLYESALFDESVEKVLEINSRNVMNGKLIEFNKDASDVRLLGSLLVSDKVAMNTYKMTIQKPLKGEMPLVELTQNFGKTFIALSSKDQYEILNEDQVSKILNIFKETNLDNKCLIQIPINESILSIQNGGKVINGEMTLVESFLDRAGDFSGDVSESTEKMYILGESSGMISTKLEYIDGHVEVFRSPCASGSILVY